MSALLPRHSLSITASYGAAGQIRGILATLRWAATGQAVAAVADRGRPPEPPRGLRPASAVTGPGPC